MKFSLSLLVAAASLLPGVITVQAIPNDAVANGLAVGNFEPGV